MGKKIKASKKADKSIENAGKAMAKSVEKVIEAVFLRDRRLTVSVGTSADFGKAKVGLSLSENIKEDSDVMVIADELYDVLVGKLEEKFDDLCEKVGIDGDTGDIADDPEDDVDEDDIAKDMFSYADDEDDEEDDDADEDDADEDDADEDDADEDDADEDDDEEITEEEILKMKKTELVKLIEDEELDINVKKLKKIADLRQAVIDALFEEDDADEDDADEDDNGSEEDDDWDSDDDDDDDDGDDDDSDWGDDD